MTLLADAVHSHSIDLQSDHKLTSYLRTIKTTTLCQFSLDILELLGCETLFICCQKKYLAVVLVGE